MDDAFGQGEPFRAGIEEELLLVDAETRRLRHDAAEVLAAMDAPKESAAHEAYAAEIELRSSPCASAAEAAEELDGLRAKAREAAGARGIALVGAGVHPTAELGDSQLVAAERYRKARADVRGLFDRTPECALHVHVAMPDREAAIRAYNGLRAWLPLLSGLAAASPLWFGVDSGLASARSALIRSYPGRGIPRALRDWEDYERALAETAAGGGPDDYTHLWWEVRPHPKLGTVEVREMDAQSRLEDVAALAALIQGLARHEASEGAEPAATETIHWSAWRAVRDGLGAEIHNRGSLRALPEVARDAVALARPHALEAGAGDALDGIERILTEGGGADRQRAAYREGGPDALLDLLVAETGSALQ